MEPTPVPRTCRDIRKWMAATYPDWHREIVAVERRRARAIYNFRTGRITREQCLAILGYPSIAETPVAR